MTFIIFVLLNSKSNDSTNQDIVKAWVISITNEKLIWYKSVDRILSRKILKSYPEPEQSKKEIQLEATLRKATEALARSLSK